MSPLGEMASPSQPSATGTLPVTRPEEVSITLIEGGLYPPLSTSRYLPSGVSAVDMGSVSSGTWRPTGSRRQPLLSRKAPPGSGPTCSRGAGCEPSMATIETKAMARAMRYFSEPERRVMGTSHCTGSILTAAGCVDIENGFAEGTAFQGWHGRSEEHTSELQSP